MAVLSTYGSTIFKFDRSGKKWKELGSGVVYFSVKEDRLVISVNKLAFIVQGGVRQKGPKAVVMRVRDDSTIKGETIILAVRFERERDTRNLFTLLASTPWIRPRSRSRKHQRRRAPPPFFLSMGIREQENIRALVSNAEPKYIEDGTIQRQLTTIYKLTAAQIEEAIDFFQPWLRRSTSTGAGKRQGHYRTASLSLGTRTESSLPSIQTSKHVKRRQNMLTPAGSTRPAGSMAALAPSHIDKHLEIEPAETPVEVESKKPPPEVTVRKIRADANEAKVSHEQPKRQLTPRKSNSKREDIGLPAGNSRAKPKGTSTLKKVDSGDAEKTPSLRHSEQHGSTPPTSSARSNSLHKGVCPLTKQNLMLHNRMVPQLKRDTHEKVTVWLKEFERE